MNEPQPLVQAESQSLTAKFAARFGVDPAKLIPALKQTAFRQREKSGRSVEITDEQMMALIIVADQHGLNPFTKEIYAFPQDGGIVPIVGIDGWMRIINNHPQFDGMDFEDMGKTEARGSDKHSCPEGITCTIHRKDRSRAIRVTEWYSECQRSTTPWREMPRRMLRHKALIQCARVAFSFSGIHDEDEGRNIIEGQIIDVGTEAPRSHVNDLLEPQADAPAEKAGSEPAVRAETEPVTRETATTTAHLAQCTADATSADDLDYVRSLNAERDATPAEKAILTKAINEKAKRLKVSAAA